MSLKLTYKDEQSLKWREWISLLSCLLMTGGMVFSRLLLSIGMILLFINALHPDYVKSYWDKFKKSRFALASFAFFIAYLVSGFWSEDKSNWLALVQIKLPFLFFPFAMYCLPLKNMQWLKLMVCGLLLFLLSGMGYGVYFLIQDPSAYSAGNHIPSPMEGDYIRFTIVIVLAMISVIYLIKNRGLLNLNKIAVGLLIAWFAIAVAYIHIQAAKSGLVCFYIFLIMFIVDFGIKQKRFKTMIGVFVIIITGLFLFSKLPSVTKQVNDYSKERRAMETKDTAIAYHASSFIPRVNSYKVSSEIIRKNPLTGVGAGDMKKEMDKIYARWFPGLPLTAYILPHNEFLCAAMSIGIPLLLLTLVIMVFTNLFNIRNLKNIYFITTWVIIFFGLMIEPMLEVQFGIFVFLFFMYLWTDIPVEEPNVSP